jgi:O-glycosyl hydrolase
VYINDPTGNINVNNSKTDGIVLDSKQLWCMGNFSRFVRPGMKRVAATINGIDDATAANTFMVSVFKDVATKKLVIVIVNMGNTGKKFILTGGGSSVNINGNWLNVFTTTSSKNLTRSVSNADNITIEAKSVTTLTGTYN